MWCTDRWLLSSWITSICRRAVLGVLSAWWRTMGVSITLWCNRKPQGSCWRGWESTEWFLRFWATLPVSNRTRPRPSWLEPFWLHEIEGTPQLSLYKVQWKHCFRHEGGISYPLLQQFYRFNNYILVNLPWWYMYSQGREQNFSRKHTVNFRLYIKQVLWHPRLTRGVCAFSSSCEGARVSPLGIYKFLCNYVSNTTMLH